MEMLPRVPEKGNSFITMKWGFTNHIIKKHRIGFAHHGAKDFLLDDAVEADNGVAQLTEFVHADFFVKNFLLRPCLRKPLTQRLLLGIIRPTKLNALNSYQKGYLYRYNK